jgi:hypothetical protein
VNLAPATPDYVQTVALGMRERDLAEFAAVSPTDDRESLAWLLRDRYGRRNGMLCACDAAGEPVAVGGAVLIRPAVATLLFFATYAFPKIALPMTRFIRRHYFPSLAAEGVHRIECVSMAGYGDMHRWLETLGMQREGVFRAYGKGREDFVQYAWVADVRPTGP